MDFVGFIKDVKDAFILVEAAKQGLVKMLTQKPSLRNPPKIKHGTTIVLNFETCGIKRWTDGKKWGSSKLIDGFFVYLQAVSLPKNSKTLLNPTPPMLNEDGLIMYKKVISVCDSAGKWFHVINYFYSGLGNIKEINGLGLSRPSEEERFDKENIMLEIRTYRFIKCYRTRSKQCRQLFGINSSLEPFPSPEMEATSPNSNSSGFKSIFSLLNPPFQSDPSPYFPESSSIALLMDKAPDSMQDTSISKDIEIMYLH